MDMEWDYKEITALANSMKNIQKVTPNNVKKFLRSEAKVLKKDTLSYAKSSVKKKTGNYLKGFKTGKVYTFNGAQSIRVYNSSPHAHLIENSHKIANKYGTYGRTKGKEILATTKKRYEPSFYKNCETFIDDFITKKL